MSRSLSTAAKQAANAQETEVAYIILLTIDHVGFVDPIRVCSEGENIVSNGNEFIAFPFELVLPDNPDGAAPSAKLVCDNIDRQIGLALRQITPQSGPASVLIQIVLSSDYDYVEVEFPDFLLTNVVMNAVTVEGDLTIENFGSKPYPSRTFAPSNFGGLF